MSSRILISFYIYILTHWGQVTHICISKLIIIGSDNGLSPGRRQAIIWTNAGILLIWTLGTNFSEILSEIHAFSFMKMHLKRSSAKWLPFCLSLNVLTHWGRDKMAAIFQTTFSNGFSWMKIYEFWLTFHWSLFLGLQLTIFHHWFRKWLGADQATSHDLNQWWLDYRRIYVSLGLNELIYFWCNWKLFGQAIITMTNQHTWSGWCHDMKMLSTLLAFSAGNPLVTGGFPSQRCNKAELWGVLWCQPEQTAQ